MKANYGFSAFYAFPCECRSPILLSEVFFNEADYFLPPARLERNMDLAGLFQPRKEACICELFRKPFGMMALLLRQGRAHVDELGVLAAPPVLARKLVEHMRFQFFVGIIVHVETSGTAPFKADESWARVTCSLEMDIFLNSTIQIDEHGQR